LAFVILSPIYFVFLFSGTHECGMLEIVGRVTGDVHGSVYVWGLNWMAEGVELSTFLCYTILCCD
jgi:hypothetical protein